MTNLILMARQNPIAHMPVHYGFLMLCSLGFLVTCGIFLFYRLVLKPIAFGLILLAILPLMGRQLFKKEGG